MDRISPGKSVALVIVDMQERFRPAHEHPEKEWDLPVSNINRVADSFRTAGRPVIQLRMEGPSPCHPWGGPETDVFVRELKVADTDTVITKPHMSGFRDTELADVLRKKGCDTIVLCGTLTNFCVMNTYFSAFDNDFIPYMLKHGTVSSKEGVNEAAWTVCSAVEPEDVIDYLFQ